MSVTALPGFPKTQIIKEFCVGAAQKYIKYPGLQQCISLTGYHVCGLLGAHISPGSSAEEIDEIFQILRTGGGANYLTWYVVGQFQEHFVHTKVGWNSMTNIGKALRKQLAKNAAYYAFDTSKIVLDNDFSWGVDVRAKLDAPEVDFAYAQAFSMNPTFTAIADGFRRI